MRYKQVLAVSYIQLERYFDVCILIRIPINRNILCVVRIVN